VEGRVVAEGWVCEAGELICGKIVGGSKPGMKRGRRTRADAELKKCKDRAAVPEGLQLAHPTSSKHRGCGPKGSTLPGLHYTNDVAEALLMAAEHAIGHLSGGLRVTGHGDTAGAAPTAIAEKASLHHQCQNSSCLTLLAAKPGNLIAGCL